MSPRVSLQRRPVLRVPDGGFGNRHGTVVEHVASPLKPVRPPCDLAAAVVDLASEVFDCASADMTLRALERLRHRAHAEAALVWVVDGTRARCALHVGHGAQSDPSAVAPIEDSVMAISRLRHTGALLCRAGEVSGVEDLVPEGIRSFAAAAAESRGSITAVLVIGWTAAAPPCDEALAGPLRIAAALLARALTVTSPASTPSSAHEAVLESLAERVATVDREGTIIAVNAAWTTGGQGSGIAGIGDIGPGVNYLDVWRRAVSSGDQDAAAVVEGIAAVCDGTSGLFETAYRCRTPRGDRWCVMTVTPLRRPEGGAVIAHADVTHPKIVELAIVAGGARFNELADAVPVPIWIATPDGRVVYGNHAWVEATGSAGGDALADGRWTDAFHPDDRAAAAAAFTAAASRCEAFTIELRLEASDGTCRWWTCIGTPRCAPDGRLQSYVGICHDVTAQRAAQSAFDALAAKLVATQEKERSRIGRELHDDIGQQVALLSSMVDTLLRDRHWSRERIYVVLTETQRHLQDMATSLHVLSHELHPGKLKLLGLVATLETLCRDLSREQDAEIRCEAEHVPAVVAEETAICLFRVAQEALQNAAKHSGARSITVRVSGGPSHLTLAVADDGSGFDPLASQSAGLGLLTMRERVELLGGRLRIETAPGRGTTIEATVPLTVAEPTAGVG